MEEQLIYICMFVSIAVSALCSVLEATLLSTPLSYITGLEDQGVKGAKRLKKLKQNTERPIAAILCINTIANTVGASLVGSLVMKVYGNTLVGVFSAIFTLLILVFSEIFPKTIGSPYWRRLAIPASGIINVMIFIVFPIVWVMEKLTKFISDNADQVSVSREDISAMVSVATEEEVIEKDEKKMIQNLLKLDEITAHEIMTPSVVVEMASGNMTAKELYDKNEYAAVITDIIMQGQNGFDIILDFRNKNQLDRVIAISGGGRTSSEDYLSIAKNFGVTSIFSKPPNYKDLIAKVDEIVQSHKQA